MARQSNTEPTPDKEGTQENPAPDESKVPKMNEAGEVGLGEAPEVGSSEAGTMFPFNPADSTPAERLNPDRRELSPGELHDAAFHASIDQGRPKDESLVAQARRVPDPKNRADLQDFPSQSTGDGVYITNSKGATHTVPGDWVTEDSVGNVRLRGNLGYRWATDEEIQAYRDEFDPKPEDNKSNG